MSNATRTWATGPASSDTTKVNKLSMIISKLSHTFSCRNNLSVTKFVFCGVFFPRRRDHGARMLDQGQGWSATRVSLTLRHVLKPLPRPGVLQGVRDEQLRGGHREVLLLQLLSLQQGPCLVLLLCSLPPIIIMVTFYHIVHFFCCQRVFNLPDVQVAESSTLMQENETYG